MLGIWEDGPPGQELQVKTSEWAGEWRGAELGSLGCVDQPEGVGESTAAKARRAPNEPLQHEIEEHKVAHEPYRAWCSACVAGRGIGDRHSTATDGGQSLPVVAIDYGTDGGEHEDTPLLCG